MKAKASTVRVTAHSVKKLSEIADRAQQDAPYVGRPSYSSITRMAIDHYHEWVMKDGGASFLGEDSA